MDGSPSRPTQPLPVVADRFQTVCGLIRPGPIERRPVVVPWFAAAAAGTVLQRTDR